MFPQENTLQEPDQMTSAIQFINSTSSHIFLTGKAGTGKTTFLRNLAARTHKQLTIVAPTGIAALNAGGVTIHSQFLLPFGMFIPDRNAIMDFNAGVNCYTGHTLAQKHSLNSARKQVLRAIDLLVIDEVSMLRADLLDAIDYRMKAARGNFTQSFGGAQVLLIGDLYQLPPVVKREEEMLVKQYYPSVWFFESKALKQDGFVYIELDKIFRQQDNTFIDLLNNLRNNKPTLADIEELNRHYKSQEEIRNMREVITLTTHNYKADDLNLRTLKALEAPSHVFHASVEGEFPESMYPVLHALELKVGAQIMFTKNDTDDKMYFNGKLATVKHISRDEIKVEMAESHIPFTLKKALWQNKRYTISNDMQEIDDEIIGTFEQFPVKLAWAITVHKSQGLTFEKAIIDVGEAFADGQVYVALSRLRSIDGLIMRTRIDPNVISTDKQIVTFTSQNNLPETLPGKMKVKQQEYIRQLISKTFDFENLAKECAYIQRSKKDTIGFEEKSIRPVLEQLHVSLLDEKENTTKFRRQLMSLLESNSDLLMERIKKGSEYYKAFLQVQARHLLHHIEEMRQRKKMKTYLNNLSDLDLLFCKKLEELDKALYLTESILQGKYQFDFSSLTEERAALRAKVLKEIQSEVEVVNPGKKKKAKTAKKKKDEISTYDITLNLLATGMSVDEIAQKRELAAATIEGHLAKAVEEEKISIFKFMDKQKVGVIESALRSMPEDFSSKDLFSALEGKYSYGQLRAVMSYVRLMSVQRS